MNKSAYTAWQKAKANFRSARINYPGLLENIGGGTLAGSVLGGGLGHHFSSDDKLLKDKGYQQQLRELAKQKGIDHEKDPEKFEAYRKKWNRINRGIATLGGGFAGAQLGSMLGSMLGAQRYSSKYQAGGNRGGGYRPGPSVTTDMARKTLGMQGNIKTKAEAKKIFRQQAMKHHSDHGGSDERMAKMNEAWKVVKESSWFEKLSYELNPILNGFCKQAARSGHAISK
jgi:hypothetical protein